MGSKEGSQTAQTQIGVEGKSVNFILLECFLWACMGATVDMCVCVTKWLLLIV